MHVIKKKVLVFILSLAIIMNGCTTIFAAGSYVIIRYSANSADSGSVPTTVSCVMGSSITVSDNIGNLTKKDHIFGGWLYGNTICHAGDVIAPLGDTVLKAVWIPVYPTYNANGYRTIPVDNIDT